MAIKPILFSGEMVRALLAGSKTQTRRVLKDAPHDLAKGEVFADCLGGKWRWSRPGGGGAPFSTPHVPGDLLYVREEHRRIEADTDSGVLRRVTIQYDADRFEQIHAWPERSALPRFDVRRPGMHMPREISRLTLCVTATRVQRLQEISGDDCVAEGLSARMGPPMGVYDDMRARSDEAARRWAIGMRAQFRDLWDGLNAKRGFGWYANPWVVATSFKVFSGNVDILTETEDGR
jgi:hypothetical protein